MQITVLESDGHERWDQYVRRSDRATFFHLTGWIQALEAVFRLKSRYVYAEEDGVILGVCPLFIVKNLAGKCRLVSIPIGVYGGIVAESPAVAAAIHLKVRDIALTLKAQRIEYRFKDNDHVPMGTEMVNKNTHVTFIRELPEKWEECLQLVPRKARADIRKAIDKGLQLKEDNSLLKDCYRIYSTNQRDLGSPIFSYEWFRVLQATFKDHCTVHSVMLGDKPIAGVLSFLFRDQVLPFYGASLRQYRNYHPDGFMYHALQEWAVKNGFRWFDFGRSKINAGTYDFKRNQGFEPRALYYQECSVGPQNPKPLPEGSAQKCLGFVSSLWKKVPLCVANRLGPLLYPQVLP